MFLGKLHTGDDVQRDYGNCRLVVMHTDIKDGHGLVETLVSDRENLKHIIVVDQMLKCTSVSLTVVGGSSVLGNSNCTTETELMPGAENVELRE